jgi:site-specific recombinase XerD
MHIKAKPADPLRKRSDVTRVKNYIRENYGDLQAMLFIMGCNSGLRGSDLRNLTFRYITMPEKKFCVTELKTGKKRVVYVNAVMQNILDEYLEWEKKRGVIYINPDSPMFVGAQNMLWGVKYMHEMISTACRDLKIRGNFGSHTMRKTFAYHVYKKCGSVYAVKDLLNHSDIFTTRLYLQDFECKLGAKNEQLDMAEICEINLE